MRALAFVVPASKCGVRCLSLVGPRISWWVGGMGDIPVEVLFPERRERFEVGSSGWSRVLGLDAVGGPPHRDFADEGSARVTSRWCPDWLGVTLAGVILDLVGDVSPIAATSTPVTAPIGCSRGQISTRLSRLLAAGWSRCRQRCSTCFGTTLKLGPETDGRSAVR